MLTADQLREVVSYNPVSGVFTRIKSSKRTDLIGSLAGHVARDGYVVFTVLGRCYLAHRLAWLYMKGCWPTDEIDHVDRNRANNAWINLREATPELNAQNRSLRSDNKSGVVGVRRDRNTWVATIRVKGKSIFLGRFQDIETAAAVRKVAEEKYQVFNRREAQLLEIT